jgi:hypothetical protein
MKAGTIELRVIAGRGERQLFGFFRLEKPEDG